jgi:hypothetical protein
LSTVEQVSLFTQLAATHPLKRRIAAELGRFASRARLVLSILCFTIKLSYGAKGDCSKREEMFAPLYCDLST